MLADSVLEKLENNIYKISKISSISITVITSNSSHISLISSTRPNSFSSFKLIKPKDHLPSELTLSKPEEKNSLSHSFKEESTLIHLLIGALSVSKSTKLKYPSVPLLNILQDTTCCKVPLLSYPFLLLTLNPIKKYLIWPQHQEEKLPTSLKL
jgi:hypothetical protein